MAYVFDIDWTLTIANKWSWIPNGNEKPRNDIINTLHRLRSQWNKIFILTGREDKYRRVTEEWLRKNDIKYDNLFMREDEHIGSTAYKRTKINRLLIPGRKIQWWYDDNPGVQKIAGELNIPFTLVK